MLSPAQFSHTMYNCGLKHYSFITFSFTIHFLCSPDEDLARRLQSEEESSPTPPKRFVPISAMPPSSPVQPKPESLQEIMDTELAIERSKKEYVSTGDNNWYRFLDDCKFCETILWVFEKLCQKCSSRLIVGLFSMNFNCSEFNNPEILKLCPLRL